MFRNVRIPTVLLLVLAAACSDDRAPTAPAGAPSGEPAAVGAVPDAPGGHAAAAIERARLERLAERLAVALGDAEFRGYVHGALERSPLRERKLHFQRLLEADGRRGLRAVARLNGLVEAELAADVGRTIPAELYLPVPAHRAAWGGDEHFLVATALADEDVPIAFDASGRRQTLDATAPPAVPVLALVPAETDFDAIGGPSGAQACPEGDCGGGGGGGGGTTPPAPTYTPGLWMTKSHLNETFESWLKGSPEIEILVLGQKGASDSLTKYQCIGQRASGSYNFDQDDENWTGDVLLFSQTQLNNYKAAHANQGVRLFFMEDDDTSCELRQNKNDVERLLGAVDAATSGRAGGRDEKSGTLPKIFRYIEMVIKVYPALASLLNSNDDMIGNAVEDDVAGEFSGGFNWVLRGEDNRTNGFVNLIMR